ncbi:hypothetical protein [Paracoccus sp. PAR01]|uniref:hypothetical protein n=1 Tax=Paracoccus sp. PAR01 TaxID=2769282 RepID=UPI001781A62A|nr:hypothetical protein [Paracoccus sp. PAR01]
MDVTRPDTLAAFAGHDVGESVLDDTLHPPAGEAGQEAHGVRGGSTKGPEAVIEPAAHYPWRFASAEHKGAVLKGAHGKCDAIYLDGFVPECLVLDNHWVPSGDCCGIRLEVAHDSQGA